MTTGINELAEAAGKTLKVAPNLYDDTVKATAQESGKLLGRIPKLINAALAPLDVWILKKEYTIEKTKKILALKLETISPDKIVSPEPYVAVPALQAISYSMDSDELRNMYANLLSNSMNIDNKDKVHPAFIEIIKQLSPFDAKFLKSFADSHQLEFPIIKIRRITDKPSEFGMDVRYHILEPKFGICENNINDFDISIGNLIRLNLISVDYSESFLDKTLYEPIENSNLVTCIKQLIACESEYNLCKIKHGILRISSLGNSFIKLCIS